MKDRFFPRRLYGHRGSSATHVENTLEAFAAAITDGAHGIETDVHLSADGEVVVFHDEDGQRLASDPRRVEDLDLATLKGWRLNGQGEVPTLDELLDAIPDVPITMDLKPDKPELAHAVISILKRRRAESRVCLASFHGSQVNRVRDLGYQGPTALTRFELICLLYVPFVPLLRRLVSGQVASIPVTSDSTRLDDPAFIARIQAVGARVDYWVVNEVAEAKRLLDLGANGILSDAPADLVSLFPTRPG